MFSISHGRRSEYVSSEPTRITQERIRYDAVLRMGFSGDAELTAKHLRRWLLASVVVAEWEDADLFQSNTEEFGVSFVPADFLLVGIVADSTKKEAGYIVIGSWHL